MIQRRFFHPQREKHHHHIKGVGVEYRRAVEHVAAIKQSPKTGGRQDGTKVIVVLKQKFYSSHDIQAKSQKQVGKQRHEWRQRTLHNVQTISFHVVLLIIITVVSERLHVVQLTIIAINGQQFFMCSTFNDAPFVQHAYLVGILNGRQAVGNGHRGACFHQSFKGVLH